MREIKFRALLNDGDKKWWEYYTTFSQPSWLDLQDVEITVKDLQYTNLKDKNGKEIYEGDIVKMLDDWIDHYKLYSNHQIEFGNGTFRLENGVPLSDCMGEEDNFDKCIAEIIGNIYENKNVLR